MGFCYNFRKRRRVTEVRYAGSEHVIISRVESVSQELSPALSRLTQLTFRPTKW